MHDFFTGGHQFSQTCIAYHPYATLFFWGGGGGGGYSNGAVVRCIHPCITLGPCEHDRDLSFFIKLGKYTMYVNHEERINPIDFGGQRS